ncbi:MAG: enoyl-CoA hydratase [Peptococcaceae bacterium]|nr:enoyl-CoA hydratase [Peptococcaceae bacterium]
MEKLLVNYDGPLGWLIFNNPRKRNALNLEMWRGIPEIIHKFNEDENIRVIILRGAGTEAFASGADISEFGELRSSLATSERYNRATEEAFSAIKSSAKPVIAMIHGFCVGGGCAIALQCDLRVASEEARFGIPAAKLGIAYGYEAVKQLVNVAGAPFAKEMLFTGRVYDAETALRMGLIHHKVPTLELETFTREYVLTIARNAPLTIRSVKMAVEEYLKEPELRDLHKVELEMARCFDSQDYQEGYRAFLEKRKPRFQGK